MTAAIQGVSNPKKEECNSEEEAIALFHNALLSESPTPLVVQVVPETRQTLCWEDVYPGIARPIKKKTSTSI